MLEGPKKIGVPAGQGRDLIVAIQQGCATTRGGVDGLVRRAAPDGLSPAGEGRTDSVTGADWPDQVIDPLNYVDAGPKLRDAGHQYSFYVARRGTDMF